MATEYYYTKNGEQIGPVSSTELKRLAGIGELQPSDQIWQEGMPDWVPASRVKGLFPVAPASVPTQPKAATAVDSMLPPVSPPMPKQSSEQSDPPTESAAAAAGGATNALKSIGEKVANVAKSERVKTAAAGAKGLAMSAVSRTVDVARSERVQGLVTVAKVKWVALSIAGKCGVVVVASVLTVAGVSVGVSSFKAVTGIGTSSYSAKAMAISEDDFGGELQNNPSGSRADLVQALQIFGVEVGEKFHYGDGELIPVSYRGPAQSWVEVFGEPQNLRKRVDFVGTMSIPFQSWTLDCTNGRVTFAGVGFMDTSTGRVVSISRLYLYDY
jgi:hypothetical protein